MKTKMMKAVTSCGHEDKVLKSPSCKDFHRQKRVTHLHASDGVIAVIGLHQKWIIFSVLGDPLEKTERLVKRHRHRDAGQFLPN